MKTLAKLTALLFIVMAAWVTTSCTEPEPEIEDEEVRVKTYMPQEITHNSAVCGGDVITTQGLALTSLGVCWSKEELPTAADAQLSTTNWREPYVCTITELEPNTEYHVRAFALRGLEYYYGEEKSFTTKEDTTGGGGGGGYNPLLYKPTVEFVQGDGYISSNTSMYVNNLMNFKVRVAPNEESMSPLAYFDFSITDQTGTTVDNVSPPINDPTGENIYEFSFVTETPATYIITATITDIAGGVQVAAVVVDCVEPVPQGIGCFGGSMTISGHLTSNSVTGMPTYDENIEIRDITIFITMGFVQEDNRVPTTIEINGNPVTLYGTIDGNTIVFDEFYFNWMLSLFTDVPMQFRANMIGTLENNILSLSGTANGTGETLVMFATFSAEVDGTVSGDLEKME